MSVHNELSQTDHICQQTQAQTKAPNWHKLAKVFLDKTVALSALLLLSPLLLIIAVAIKLDSKGPVIFFQKRNGLNNQEFGIWKFRTMKVMENDNCVKQAEKNDARITRTGNFLRKTSLDELPQLVNVLLGDMSLVGPRPHPVALNEKFSPLIKNYDQRTCVKPGLTGWAQVNGYRGPTDTVETMQKRIDCDVAYINRWSIWFDLRIILATPYYGLISKNAF